MNYDDWPRVPCIRCGTFHYAGHENCSECRRTLDIFYGKSIARHMKENGIVPEERRKRGRRAYNNRLINMSQTNPERYQNLIASLAKREPRRAAYVRGRARRSENAEATA